MNSMLLITLCLSLPLLTQAQYSVQPRWGQATLLLQDTLLIHGGKTDPANGQSYTSAPDNAEVLYLDLSNSFSAATPPWELVNSPLNETSVQGPSVAWHTINAVNTSHAILFGGLPDANDLPPIVNLPDSVAILDAFNRISPKFTLQPSQWADQPARRIHHTAVSALDGRVYIIGGEKPDNPTSAYSDNYVFDIKGPSFTLLPAGIPDLTGHCSVILPNGHILVLGGYSPSVNQLSDFGTIHVLDSSQSTPSWSNVSTTGTSPGGRRAFACTLYGTNTIYIHGGSDGSHQTIYSDGWVLDISQPTWTWSALSALSQLGARSDHFAISTSDEIIFGFGYGASAPAPTPLQIFRPGGSSGDNTGNGNGGNGGSEGSWSDTHSQSSDGGGGGGSSPGTNTVPGPTFTPSRPTNTASPGSSGIHPTSTAGQNTPSEDPQEEAARTKSTTAIAVGTALGLCAALVGMAIVAHRVRKRRRVRSQFMALGGDDENIPPSGLPAAGRAGEKQYSRRSALLHDDPTQGGLGRDILAAVGIPALAVAVHRVVHSSQPLYPERRDMLEDEDARSLGAWYDNQQRNGTGGSTWSLRSMLPARMRREGSAISSRPPSPWVEKNDPFSDGAALLRDSESGYIGAVPVGAGISSSSRPGYARRQQSYESSYSYTDPFSDPFAQPQPQVFANLPRGHRNEPSGGTADYTDESEPIRPYRHPIHPPTTPFQTGLPFDDEPHALSPLTEASSRGTLVLPGSGSESSHSHHKSSSFDRSTTNMSPFDSFGASSQGHDSNLTSGSRITSLASVAKSSSPLPSGAQSPLIPGGIPVSPRPTSMLDGSNQPRDGLVKRSDSWWARFARSPINRRNSDASASSATGAATAMFEFRDPNPLPARLGAISEGHSQHTTSPDDSPHNSNNATKHPSRLGSEQLVGHGKSMSSLRTLDSAAIENMSRMDVVQRIRTGSQKTRESSGSYDSHLNRASSLVGETGNWVAKSAEGGSSEVVMSPVEADLADSPFGAGSSLAPSPLASPVYSSPARTPPEHPPSRASPQSLDSPSSPGKRPRPPSGSAVAARIQAFEKRASMDLSPPPPPTNTRSKEERRGSKGPITSYGLVPRASLFVANPDRKNASGDS